MFKYITSVVPDWMMLCAMLPMLPTRASDEQDYYTMVKLVEAQAQYIALLKKRLHRYHDQASDSDFKEAERVIEPETRKLRVLDTRIGIYDYIWNNWDAYMFTEQRLPTWYTSKNEKM